MALSIYVNGSKYIYWKEAKLRRSIDDASGSFSFKTSPTIDSNFPINKGSKVQVLVDGQTRLTGFVEGISGVYSKGQSSITVLGRDNTCDLIDSSIKDGARYTKGSITLSGLCKKVIGVLGADIGVVDKANPPAFSAEEIESAEFSGNALQFLQSFARKKNVFFTCDGQGNLVLFRPPLGISSGSLIHRPDDNNNSITKVSFEFNDSYKYNTYGCSSQDNPSADPFQAYPDDDTEAEKSVDRRKEYIDSEIRSSRYYEIQAEEQMDDAEVLGRCEEECNIRRGRGFNATYTVPTHSMNGGVWSAGDTVMVDDPFSNIIGTYLIRTVEYLDGFASGSSTNITITYPDTYTGKGGRSMKSKRTAPSNLFTESE